MKRTKKHRAKSVIAAISLLGISVANLSLAANEATTKLKQKINNADKSIDIVNSEGDSVLNPSIDFGALDFSFEGQVSTAKLGETEQIIRIQNPTETTSWTVSLAAKNPGDLWVGANGNEYDFNDESGYSDGIDTDSVGGQMSIKPSDSGVNFSSLGSRCNANDITLGADSSFKEGVLDDIDLVVAGSNASPFCRWELTDIPVDQMIPAAQPGDDYTLDLVLTII